MTTTLRDLIQSLREFHFVLVEPGGNFGDKLIYVGAESLFRDCGVSWERVPRSEFMTRRGARDEVAYLHGSGGFNRWCSGWALRIVERALEAGYRTSIQGPQTTDQDDDYIARQLIPAISKGAGTDLFFFARELRTLERLQGVWPRERHLLLDEDTALHTSRDYLQGLGAGVGRYDLLAIRSDPESPSIKGDRRDGSHGAVELDPPYFARTFEHWVRLHARARTIATNRTHSSVLGTLLGKDVTMLAGSYHKNRSIWEFSLDKRGVKWADRLTEIPRGLHLGDKPSQLARLGFQARLALRGVPLR